MDGIKQKEKAVQLCGKEDEALAKECAASWVGFPCSFLSQGEKEMGRGGKWVGQKWLWRHREAEMAYGGDFRLTCGRSLILSRGGRWSITRRGS